MVAFLAFFSCSQKKAKNVKDEIMPLSPYEVGEIWAAKGKLLPDKKRNYVKYFIVYNNSVDTNILKKHVLELFETDSIKKFISSHYQCQFNFYKASERLDTSFRYTKYKSLFDYSDEYFARVIFIDKKIDRFDLLENGIPSNVFK